jgi:membrane protease YdiL (CAAX protease family)
MSISRKTWFFGGVIILQASLLTLVLARLGNEGAWLTIFSLTISLIFVLLLAAENLQRLDFFNLSGVLVFLIIIAIPYVVFGPVSLIFPGIGSAIVFAMRAKNISQKLTLNIPREQVGWILLGILVGFSLPLIVSLPDYLRLRDQIQYHDLSWILDSFARYFLFNLFFIALIEEIAYRGILWGFLKKIGLNSSIVLIGISSLLFWLLHFGLADTGIQFWLVIPAISIFMGLLANKTHSLLPSLFFHTFYNTVTFLSYAILMGFGI